MPLVMAADIGGTRSRIALLRIPGAGRRDENRGIYVVDYVEGPGANFRSNPEHAAANVSESLSALRSSARGISSACLGIAGAGAAGHAEVARFVRTGLDRARFDYDPSGIEVTSDLDVAFHGAGALDAGLLVLAGTGAVAARFDAGTLTRRCDGMGWMLGDQGSAAWIARRCLEAVAADVDQRGQRTQLTGLLFNALGLPDPRKHDDAPQALIACVYQLTVPEIAQLARHIEPALEGQDTVASAIVREAASAIVRNARVAWAPLHLTEPPVPPQDVVLAGGTLLHLQRLRAQVEAGLKGHFGLSVRLHESQSPLLGAVHRAAVLAGFPQTREAVAAVDAAVARVSAERAS
ncbi:hypothetical protein JT358_16210 [Micrococcales bacterium 31B]|nr:hypothetical protein [Micrococcales bacterium 31B]